MIIWDRHSKSSSDFASYEGHGVRLGSQGGGQCPESGTIRNLVT